MDDRSELTDGFGRSRGLGRRDHSGWRPACDRSAAVHGVRVLPLRPHRRRIPSNPAQHVRRPTGPRRPTSAAWTAASSPGSCTPPSAIARCTPRWRCCSGSTGCGSARRAPPTSKTSAANAATASLRIVGKGNKPAVIPLVPRTARTIDLAVGERASGPILLRADGQRLDARTAYRWVRSIGRRAGLERVHPHMLRAAFIMAALDAGVPLRDVQIAARHADPRTTTIYDRRRENFDRHAAYAVVAYVTSG